MQFPLHLPCGSAWLSLPTSMGLSLPTSMGLPLECIEVASNRIVPQCLRLRWSLLHYQL
jgi:hypothetical protein